MKTLLKKYKYLALAGALLLTGYTGVNAWANFPYGGNQVVAHGDAVALQANGQIAWSSSPGWASTDGQGMTMAEAASYVRGCSSQSGNTLITNAQLQACRVLSTTVNQLNDPWLTATTTYWTQSGGQFVANSSISGSPSNTYWFESTTGSANTDTIKQSITPTTVYAGTTLVARAYASRASATELTGNTCNDNTGSGTQTGAATVAIVNSGGTVVASASASSTTMSPISISYSVATTGQYYVEGIVTEAYEQYQYDVWNATLADCTVHSATAQAGGNITDLTIGNS